MQGAGIEAEESNIRQVVAPLHHAAGLVNEGCVRSRWGIDASRDAEREMWRTKCMELKRKAQRRRGFRLTGTSSNVLLPPTLAHRKAPCRFASHAVAASSSA
jgi:hypothetical protein